MVQAAETLKEQMKKKVKQKTLTFCWCQVWKVIWVIGLVAQTRSDIDGDDHNEPISDAARSILDGHVVLSRKLAHANHYPAIDVLASISRVSGAVTTPEQRRLMGELRQLMAAEAEARDLIEIGAYVPGTNPVVDRAVALREPIRDFLCQFVDERWNAAQSFERLGNLLASQDNGNTVARMGGRQ